MKHTELRGPKDALHTRPCRRRGRDFCQEWEPEREILNTLLTQIILWTVKATIKKKKRK